MIFQTYETLLTCLTTLLAPSAAMYNPQSMDAIVKDGVIAFQIDFNLVVSRQR